MSRATPFLLAALLLGPAGLAPSSAEEAPATFSASIVEPFPWIAGEPARFRILLESEAEAPERHAFTVRLGGDETEAPASPARGEPVVVDVVLPARAPGSHTLSVSDGERILLRRGATFRHAEAAIDASPGEVRAGVRSLVALRLRTEAATEVTLTLLGAPGEAELAIGASEGPSRAFELALNPTSPGQANVSLRVDGPAFPDDGLAVTVPLFATRDAAMLSGVAARLDDAGSCVLVHAEASSREATGNAELRVERLAPDGPRLLWREALRLSPETVVFHQCLPAARAAAGDGVRVGVAGPLFEPQTADVLIAASDPAETWAEAEGGLAPAPPPRLVLKNDTVNADAKRKRPGEELITRLVLEGFDASRPALLRVQVLDYAGATVLARERTVDPPAAGAPWTVEDRVQVPPAAAETHRAVFEAVQDARRAIVERSFLVVDVPSELRGWADLPNASYAVRGARLHLEATVHDANFVPGRAPPGFVAKAFRGSVAAAGVAVAAGIATPVAGDPPGMLRVPITLRVTDATPAGTVRISLYEENATGALRLLGSRSAEFRAPPPPAELHVGLPATPGTDLAVDVVSPPDTWIAEQRIALLGPRGEVLAERHVAGNARVTLPVPTGVAPGTRLIVSADPVLAPGAPLDPDAALPGAQGEVEVAHVDPTVGVHVAGDAVMEEGIVILGAARAPAWLEAAIRSPHMTGDLEAWEARLQVAATDGTFLPESVLPLVPDGPGAAIGSMALPLPGGSYGATLTVADPWGREASMGWNITVAPVAALAVEAPAGLDFHGGEARPLVVRNLGRLAVRITSIDVTSPEGPLPADVRVDGGPWSPVVRGESPWNGALEVAPGARAEIEIRVTTSPPGPDALPVRIRVGAKASGGAV